MNRSTATVSEYTDIKIKRTATPFASGVIVCHNSMGSKLMRRSFSSFYAIIPIPLVRKFSKDRRGPILVQVEGHGHRQIDAHGAPVERRRLVLPLLHRANGGRVQKRIDRFEDLHVLHGSAGGDDGLQDHHTLHAGLA